MAPLEKSDGHLLLNNDSKEVKETEHSSMMTPPPSLQTVADANLTTKLLTDSNFYHLQYKCRVKQREQVWEPWRGELTSMKLTVSTAPLPSCLLCDGGKPDIFVQRWQNVHLLSECVQQMQDTSNVER